MDTSIDKVDPAVPAATQHSLLHLSGCSSQQDFIALAFFVILDPRLKRTIDDAILDLGQASLHNELLPLRLFLLRMCSVDKIQPGIVRGTKFACGQSAEDPSREVAHVASGVDKVDPAVPATAQHPRLHLGGCASQQDLVPLGFLVVLDPRLECTVNDAILDLSQAPLHDELLPLRFSFGLMSGLDTVQPAVKGSAELTSRQPAEDTGRKIAHVSSSIDKVDPAVPAAKKHSLLHLGGCAGQQQPISLSVFNVRTPGVERRYQLARLNSSGGSGQQIAFVALTLSCIVPPEKTSTELLALPVMDRNPVFLTSKFVLVH